MSHADSFLNSNICANYSDTDLIPVLTHTFPDSLKYFPVFNLRENTVSCCNHATIAAAFLKFPPKSQFFPVFSLLTGNFE